MSALYLDILKDRLYVSRADSPARRSAQSTLWDLLTGLTAGHGPHPLLHRRRGVGIPAGPG